ncbi:hypothetical protein [Actinopolyspora xinjiangensis]|uniref:hypothetical protein n=1 Tax=Actinopolyspora xinjiangensis TaxID=405564 RepID=UPI001113FBAE|nr:hypothetical protein [Actinopolyspora xinjiangensis]
MSVLVRVRRMMGGDEWAPVLDSLGALTEKSLSVSDSGDRYRMIDTTRTNASVIVVLVLTSDHDGPTTRPWSGSTLRSVSRAPANSPSSTSGLSDENTTGKYMTSP